MSKAKVFSRTLLCYLPFPFLCVLFPILCGGQPALHFKTGDIATAERWSGERNPKSGPTGRGHLLVQFDIQPSPDTIASLKRRGIDVLQDVPENGLLISLGRRVNVEDLGTTLCRGHRSSRQNQSRIVPAVFRSCGANGFFLVEFHPDVDINRARPDFW